MADINEHHKNPRILINPRLLRASALLVCSFPIVICFFDLWLERMPSVFWLVSMFIGGSIYLLGAAISIGAADGRPEYWFCGATFLGMGLIVWYAWSLLPELAIAMSLLSSGIATGIVAQYR